MQKKWKKNIPEKYDYKNMANYVKDKYSVCREERQYAAFLYFILLKCKNSCTRCRTNYEYILKQCGFNTGDNIKEVFYEAAFMRDFFKRDKRCTYVDKKLLKNKLLNVKCTEEEHQCPYKGVHIEYTRRFNYLLLTYLLGVEEENGGSTSPNASVLKKIIKCDRKTYRQKAGSKKGNSILDLNLGGKAGHARIDEIIDQMKNNLNPREQEILQKVETAKILMNIKPDVAVIYEAYGQLYLKFLECKFESSEGSYKLKGGILKQTDAQNYVGEFLCNQVNLELGGRKIQWNKTELIYFKREASDNKHEISDNEHEIILDKVINFQDD